MNKKSFFGLCLLVALPLCAMHNESKEQKVSKSSVSAVKLTDRDDVRSRAAACLNRLMSRGKKRLKHSGGGAYEKREKIYETVEYGDYALTVWDGGEQQ